MLTRKSGTFGLCRCRSQAVGGGGSVATLPVITAASLSRLPAQERERIVEALADIAVTRFDGRVVRNVTTSLFLFRRAD